MNSFASSRWKDEYLNSLCEIIIGRTPSRSKPDYWGPGHYWLSISDMGSCQNIVTTKETITDYGAEVCGDRLICPGTVVFSFKLSIGKIGIVRTPMYTNEAIAAFPIKNESVLFNKYLFYALKTLSFEGKTDRAVKGKTLNKKKLEEIKIPLPPIEEQRRIAAILDKADEIRRKRQEAIALTDELLRLTFLEMFGDPVTNHKGWEVKSLKEFGEVVTGNTPPRSNLDNYGDDIEWIKSDNITTPYHFLTEAAEKLSHQGKSLGRYVPANSVLVTCIAGSRSSIGRAALADREVAFNQQINAVIPNQNVEPYFLYAHFFVGQHLVQAQSTNSMKGLVSKGKFSTIEFLKPPKDEQARFATWFSVFSEWLRKAYEGKQQSNNLFNSLLQKAFKGEL